MTFAFEWSWHVDAVAVLTDVLGLRALVHVDAAAAVSWRKTETWETDSIVFIGFIYLSICEWMKTINFLKRLEVEYKKVYLSLYSTSSPTPSFHPARETPNHLFTPTLAVFFLTI